MKRRLSPISCMASINRACCERLRDLWKRRNWLPNEALHPAAAGAVEFATVSGERGSIERRRGRRVSAQTLCRPNKLKDALR